MYMAIPCKSELFTKVFTGSNASVESNGVEQALTVLALVFVIF